QMASVGAYVLLLAAPPIAMMTAAAALCAAFAIGLPSIPILIVTFLTPILYFIAGVFIPWVTLFAPTGKVMPSVFSEGFRDPGASFQAMGTSVVVMGLTGLILLAAALVSRRKTLWLAAALALIGFAGWQGYTTAQAFNRIANPNFFTAFAGAFAGFNDESKKKDCELKNQMLTVEPQGEDSATLSVAVNIVMNDAKKCSIALPAAAADPSAAVGDHPVTLKRDDPKSAGPFRSKPRFRLEYEGPDAVFTVRYTMPPFQLSGFSSFAYGPIYSFGFNRRILRVAMNTVSPAIGDFPANAAHDARVEIRGAHPALFAADGVCTQVADTLSCELHGENASILEYTPQTVIAESPRLSLTVKSEHAARFITQKDAWQKTAIAISDFLTGLGVTRHVTIMEADFVTFQAVGGTGFVGADAVTGWQKADKTQRYIQFGSVAISNLFGSRTWGTGLSPTLSDEIALITAFICSHEKGGISEDALRESLRKMDNVFWVKLQLNNPMNKAHRQNFYDLLSSYNQKPEEFKQRLAQVVQDILAHGSRAAFTFRGASDDNYVDYLKFEASEIKHEEKPGGPFAGVSSGGTGVRVELR
ncbi:MAG: hypothetical protein ACREJQ_00850, partial [bacterium]